MRAAELVTELFQGIRAGRMEAVEEAPYLTEVAGLRDPKYAAVEMPIEVGPLPDGVLGLTQISGTGIPYSVKISSRIADMGHELSRRYRKSVEWAKRWVYNVAKLTTEHELAHAQSASVARGEGMDEDTRNVMETVPTYAKAIVATRLGKHEKARTIRETNPYPRSWFIGEAADNYYPGGYASFMRDAQNEPFYKPLWRLAKASVKSGAGKIADRFRNRNAPAPAAA